MKDAEYRVAVAAPIYAAHLQSTEKKLTGEQLSGMAQQALWLADILINEAQQQEDDREGR